MCIVPARIRPRRARISCSIRSPERSISLDDRELFRRIAISYRICRIYALDHAHNAELAAALERLTGGGTDDATNM